MDTEEYGAAGMSHNLFAHNNSRNPRFDHPEVYSGQELLTGRGTVDFANNVVYNWGMKAIYGGEEGWFNVVGNYFRPGPATRHLDGEWLEISTSESTSLVPGSFYISGNVYDVSAVKKGNHEGKMPESGKIAENAAMYEEVSADCMFNIKTHLLSEDAESAYKAVLKQAGASLKRDPVDKRIIKEVKKGKAFNVGSVTGLPGIIDSENDVL